MTTETQAKTNEGVAKATGVLALGNVISRVFGLVREIVLSNLFGASAAVSAFKVAILVPKTIYDLLIAGHVNGAIIPVLSEVVTKNGRTELWRLVSILLSMTTAIMAGLVLILQLGAPLIVQIFSGGLDAYTQALAVDLLRLTSPALIFMGMFSVLSGTLYALRVFTWPAFATAVFNATVVLVALVFTPAPQFTLQLSDGYRLTWQIARPDTGITVMAIGWLVGSVAYVLLQLPGLRGSRLRLTLIWRHPGLRRIGLLYIPVMFSLVMDTLIIRPFSYNLASQTGESSIAYMDLATTLIQFPQGLVATAISIAILPTLARQAALITNLNDENSTAFRDTLGLGLRLTITLILPAAVGLYVLATPIIALLFEHGAFLATDTTSTTLVLRLYLFGLPFAALDLLLIYAFYARQDTLTPALVGLFSLVVYMLVALVLVSRYGLLSLMIADSVKHITHAAISGYLLHRRLGGFGDQRLMKTSIKTGVAVIAMGGVAFGLLQLAQQTIGIQGVVREGIAVIGIGGISGIVFIVLVIVLRVDEWHWFFSLLKRKIKIK
ncbi:MAG: murein biosynthesis integral membrane protein MurJ [Phototrophicales bacterium]|nr:MAG: murein biosynthesis integral membrane protein MurJ [Phototrophicales bacterium]RMG77690.1 MAG: murein biosynthesis integral membrane protein MurJ [Chloroflexota bacterium]